MSVETTKNRGGAPIGNRNAAGRGLVRSALTRMALENDGRRMRLLAEKVWEMALDGDAAMVKELIDRLDGKAPQSVAVSADPETPVGAYFGLVASMAYRLTGGTVGLPAPSEDR